MLILVFKITYSIKYFASKNIKDLCKNHRVYSTKWLLSRRVFNYVVPTYDSKLAVVFIHLYYTSVWCHYSLFCGDIITSAPGVVCRKLIVITSKSETSILSVHRFSCVGNWCKTLLYTVYRVPCLCVVTSVGFGIIARSAAVVHYCCLASIFVYGKRRFYPTVECR